MLGDMLAYEALAGVRFDRVVEMRGDAFWAKPLPALATLDDNSVHIKKCLGKPGGGWYSEEILWCGLTLSLAVGACTGWNGINDKFAVLPREWAEPWMDLLGHYYNDTVHGYWNSEVGWRRAG